MNIGDSMWSFHRNVFEKRINVMDFIRLAPSLGVSFMELLNVFLEETDEEISTARREIGGLGLLISAFDVGNDFAHLSDESHKKAPKKAMRGVYVALKLGAPIVSVFGGK